MKKIKMLCLSGTLAAMLFGSTLSVNAAAVIQQKNDVSAYAVTDSKPKNQFVTVGDDTYYAGEDGEYVTGKVYINGSCYYFDPDTEKMAKNQWVEVKKRMWNYFDAKGRRVYGWQKINNEWYYFDPNDYSRMITGWKTIYGKRYYFSSTGAMVTGWNYLLNDPGYTSKENYWYYFDSTGEKLTYQYVGGYWLNRDGSWTYKSKASWKKNAKGWWYGDGTGWYAKSQYLVIDGKTYIFDKNGYLID